MAGGKLPPRQKMIGMMYLVLTALLALNVSKDILEAFVVVNNGLELANEDFGEKSNALYSEFEFSYNLDKAKIGPFWEQAKIARTEATDMYAYIEALKKELVMQTEGVAAEVADTLRLQYIEKKDAYDMPTNIMIGDSPDGSAGKSRELKEEILAYKQALLNLLPEEQRANAELGLDVERDYTFDGKTLNWEMNTFYHTPLAADLTILSQLQNEVKAAEYYVVNSLYKKFQGTGLQIDTAAAKIITQSSYVLLGDVYQSDIMVAAYSNTVQPTVIIGKLDTTTGQLIEVYDTLDVTDGMGRFHAQAEREGLHEYEGLITMKDRQGQPLSFPFRSEYLVARPSATISPTAMNVMYIGPKNPLSVSVPGVPAENIRVTITGGNTIRQVGQGEYIAELSKSSPSKIQVNVSAELGNGETRNMGTQEFRVKPLPMPFAMAGGKEHAQAIPKGALCSGAAGISAKYSKDFAFQLPLTVRSFELEILLPGAQLKTLKSNSNRLTPQMCQAITSLKGRKKIEFNKIKVRDVSGDTRELSPITITVY